MPKTIIEELIVELGLDDSKMRSQARDVDRRYTQTKENLRKGGVEIESGVKRQSAAFGNLRRELIGVLALFTAGAGLRQFVSNTVRSDAAVGRLSKQIGVSTEELSAWQGVLKRSGGSAEGATSALATMTSAYQEFIATGRVSLPYLQQLGALGFRLDDLRNPTEALLKLSDIFAKLDPTRAAFLGRQLGFDEATISLLMQGRDAVEAQLEAQREIAVVSEANAQAAQRLQRRFADLTARSIDLGRQLLTYLEPAIARVTEEIERLGAWVQKNREVVIGFFIGIALALAAVGAAAIAAAAPVIALVAGVALLSAAFAKLVQENPELQQALQAVGDAAREVWDALVGLGKWIAQTPIGKRIADAFKPAGPVVKTLAGTIHGLAAALRAVAAALRGDWAGAWKALRDIGNPPPPGTANTAEFTGRPVGRGTGAAGRAAQMIRGFEGYRSQAYWDVNAYRAGYGSDTVTDPFTGRVSRVTSQTRVTRDMAERDLKRRIEQEFMPKVMRQVGSAWAQLDEATQASLISVAYNYGSLPGSVARAAKTGDRAAIAEAVRNLRSHNGGVNARRRDAEAAAIAGAANENYAALPPGARGLTPMTFAGSSTQNRTDVRIENIAVHTQATDAEGIARDLGPAIFRKMHVTQGNRGLA